MIVVWGLLVFPEVALGQVLDSARAHRLALELADDLRAVDTPTDLSYVRHSLPAIEEWFGIEFELPQSEDERTHAVLTRVYEESGAEALLLEARSQDAWSAFSLRLIAVHEGGGTALAAAQREGLLDTNLNRILNGVGFRRLDEVLSWLDQADLDREDFVRIRSGVLTYGSFYEPHRFWREAETLPMPYRIRVRSQALRATSGVDTIPTEVLAVALPQMLKEAESLEPGEARWVTHAVAAACGRRQVSVCGDLDLPEDGTDHLSNSDVINLTANGLFDQAENRLAQLRLMEPPLVIARLMAQALGHLARDCPMARCNLVRADSLAAAWLPVILSTETEVLEGRVEETHTWNGSSDLTELQRALGAYLGPHDIPATRALLSRMKDEGAIGSVLYGFIQRAPTIRLIEAVQLYLDYVPEGAETHISWHAELMRAGRADLAEKMLERATPRAAMEALAEWAYQLAGAGMTDDAIRSLREMMSRASYAYPAGRGRLMSTLVRVHMMDEYVRHVRALPTALERINGTVPILEAWVQEARSRAR
jgi:hypothetical protein